MSTSPWHLQTLYRSKKHWNHYRIDSARAPWWDYGKNGSYFLTICTKHRLPLFGSIQDGKMCLSEIGKLVLQFWQAIPKHTIPGVHMEAFVIMPNHIHGIITLDRAPGQEPLHQTKPIKQWYYQGSQKAMDDHPPHPHAKQAHARSAYFSAIKPQRGSIPQILRSFKAVVTKTARALGLLGKDEALWQSRYYDRIIRDSAEKVRITKHIQQDVQCWENDDHYCWTNTKPMESSQNKKAEAPPLQSMLDLLRFYLYSFLIMVTELYYPFAFLWDYRQKLLKPHDDPHPKKSD